MVDCVFFRCWSRWPMAVASDFGRYFFTFSLVSIGHVAKLPCLIASMKVDVDGLKHALWRNSTVSAMVPAGSTLLACPGEVGWSVGSLSWTRQRPVRVSRYPVRMVWLCKLTLTCCLVKLTSQSLSQSNATERSGFLNSLKMWPIRACGGRFGRRSSH